jgi:hypothetical protein
MAMALAASVLCGAQERLIAKAHNTVCRRRPAAPFRGCLGKEEFETLRFTLAECIMELYRGSGRTVAFGLCHARFWRPN